MTEVFDIDAPSAWSFSAEAPTALQTTMLAQAPSDLGVRFAEGEAVKPKHSAEYWARLTARFDFSNADRVPPA